MVEKVGVSGQISEFTRVDGDYLVEDRQAVDGEYLQLYFEPDFSCDLHEHGTKHVLVRRGRPDPNDDIWTDGPHIEIVDFLYDVHTAVDRAVTRARADDCQLVDDIAVVRWPERDRTLFGRWADASYFNDGEPYDWSEWDYEADTPC